MKKFLLGSLAAMLIALPAYGADMYTPEPVQDPPVYQPVETNGWYLRGDASYDFLKLRGADFYQGGDSSNLRDFDTASTKDTGNIGLGVGYQINSYLRTELAADYLFTSRFSGSTSGTCRDPEVPCVSSDRSSVSALGLMANAYVDLGTYAGFTPYVGAGIGGTRVNWSNLKNTACGVDPDDGCDPEVTHKGRGSWRFTYGLMLGASADITCNIKADVGYRYRRVAAGDMFGYANNGGPGYDKGFNIHEARAGVRYAFAGCETPYVEPEPTPLVYK